MRNRFKESLLDKNTLSVTWELVPERGAREKAQEITLASAEQAANGRKVDALTITDMPGGNPALLADYLGMEILRLGIEPLVHFTAKDKNRNQMESQLYALDRAGIRNLLILTGDYTGSGFQGRPKPVFDLDPTHTLELISRMNEGLKIIGNKGATYNQPSDFFAGCAVSPFKSNEAELMVQYYKLKKKVAGGAQFIVTQLGYDARKYHEVLQYVRLNDLNIPIMGNIYVLSYSAARVMNQNQLPGCVVTDKLLTQIDRERSSEDKGLSARLLRAAKMYAFMKGMGFDGVHIGGHNLKYEQIEFIINKGEEFSIKWQDLICEFDFPQDNGFYFYENDEKTGLNTDTPTNRRGLQLDSHVGVSYPFFKLLHFMIFSPGRAFFPLMRSIYSRKKNPRRHRFEKCIKEISNDCRDCGDCALLDMAYLCPMSQCPKNQRNGGCGGSYNGWCEVFPNEKQCVWVRAYARLKKYNEESQIDSYRLPPTDWELYQTSAWYNFYTGRDHSAKILGITKPEK